MSESYFLISIACVFLLAGTVKGIIGLGLPTVSLALLVVFIDLPKAMTLLLVPSLITNVWQAFVGGNTRKVVRHIWLFLALATAVVWLGSAALDLVATSLLTGFLGLLLVTYSTVSLAGVSFSFTFQQQRWAGPVFGIVNGIFTGMTGSFVVPGVMYLQSIGLTRDELMQAMGMLFSLSTLALAFSLHDRGMLSEKLGLLSLAALVPALAGMVIGQRIRSLFSEKDFRRVFFVSLLILGLYIAINALR